MIARTPSRRALRLSRRTQLSACVLLLLLHAGAFSAWASSDSPDILKPRLVKNKTFSETYTFIADLEGGAYIQLQLALSNIGLGSGKGACRVMWLREGAPAVRASARFERYEWGHHAGPPSRLEMGPCELRRGEGTEVRVQLEDLNVTLLLADSIRAIRPPHGRLTINGGFYESDILIPWAEARVSLQHGEDAPTRTYRGYGYADHSRSTTLPAELAQRWIRFRGLHAEGSALVLIRFPAEPAQQGVFDGWMWRQGQTSPERLRAVEVTKVARAVEGESDRWHIRLETDGGQPFVLDMERVLYRYAPMEEAGLAGRLLRGLVGNPVTYTYRAVLQRDALAEAADRSGTGRVGIGEVTLMED